MSEVLRVGEARVVSGKVYRELVEVCNLLDEAYESKNVVLICAARTKAHDILVEIRKNDALDAVRKE